MDPFCIQNNLTFLLGQVLLTEALQSARVLVAALEECSPQST